MTRFVPSRAHEQENLRFIKEQISTVIDPAFAPLNLGYTSPSGVWHTLFPAWAGLPLSGLFTEIPVKGPKSGESYRSPALSRAVTHRQVPE
jgi:hypothetical protein